jgi:hypothetical protein
MSRSVSPTPADALFKRTSASRHSETEVSWSNATRSRTWKLVLPAQHSTRLIRSSTKAEHPPGPLKDQACLALLELESWAWLPNRHQMSILHVKYGETVSYWFSDHKFGSWTRTLCHPASKICCMQQHHRAPLAVALVEEVLHPHGQPLESQQIRRQPQAPLRALQYDLELDPLYLCGRQTGSNCPVVRVPHRTDSIQFVMVAMKLTPRGQIVLACVRACMHA